MTLKEERYYYFYVPKKIVGSDALGQMINLSRPKPNDSEHFEFVLFSNDWTRNKKDTICFYWIYKVYEK